MPGAVHDTVAASLPAPADTAAGASGTVWKVTVLATTVVVEALPRASVTAPALTSRVTVPALGTVPTVTV